MDSIPIEYILFGGVWLLVGMWGKYCEEQWRGPSVGDADAAQQEHNRQFGGPKP